MASNPEPRPVVEYGARRLLIVFGVMLAALLQTLDATIVNVALPTIEGNVGASIDDGTWIVTGYIISNVVTIPLTPFLMQRLGRRKYYASCIGGFTVASVLCGTATTLPLLVAYRIVQGAFGGGLVATAQIVLRDTFPPDKIGSSSALFAIALTVGPALGPTIGGWLTDTLSWPWVFDINLVPGIIAFAIVATVLKNPAEPRHVPFDTLGFVLLLVALGSTQFVLDEGERRDWLDDESIRVAVGAALFGFAAFIGWEAFGARAPVIDLRVFRYRAVQVGIPLALLQGMIIFGPTFLLPQYVQSVLGFTATLSGLLILARAMPVLFATPIVARIMTRVDAWLIQVVCFITSAIVFRSLALSMTSQSDFGSFAGLLAVAGIAQSGLIVPLLVSVLGTVPPAEAPRASSLISLSVQFGGSIASTLLVTLFDRRVSYHAEIERAGMTLHNPAVSQYMSHGGSVATLVAELRRQATAGGFADAMIALVPIAGLAAVLVILLRSRKGSA